MGIKDKVLAAFRADITEIVLPKENEKDLEDIPEEIRDVLTVHFVEMMDEVLAVTLDGEITPLPKGEFNVRPRSLRSIPGTLNPAELRTNKSGR